MNKEQHEIMTALFVTIYDFCEKLDDYNTDHVKNDRIDKAVEHMITGLDIISEVLDEYESKLK